jgi:uncharacterized protein
VDALRRRIFRAALPLVFSATATSAFADPALWKVSDTDSAIWLFGSVHILDAATEWRTPAFDDILANADEVYFELLLNEESMAELGMLSIQRGFLPAGETLSGLLTDDQNKQLDKALGEIGMNRMMVEQMRPWMAGITISTAALAQSGAAGDANFAGGIESQLQAEIADERERGLETTEEQLDFMSMGTPEEQAAALMQTVDQLDEANAAFGGLIDAWLVGDIDTVHAEVVDSVGSVESEEYQVLLAERNRKWTVKLAELLTADVEAMIIVGAAHLAGPLGVPAMLEELGFAVERIDAGQ